MTDNAPLTDEELAAIKAQWKAALNANIQSGDPLIRTPFAHIPRLVAALRACRAEIENLTRQVITLKSYRHDYPELQAEVERLSEQNDGLYQAVIIQNEETKRLEAEVERLRAENTQLEKWIPSGW